MMAGTRLVLALALLSSALGFHSPRGPALVGRRISTLCAESSVLASGGLKSAQGLEAPPAFTKVGVLFPSL